MLGSTVVERESPPTAERVHRPSLSPSRALDFTSCPMLFRFRTVDRLPEAGSPEALRGTLVHRVLELLFDLPAAERTVDAARGLIPTAWEEVRAAESEATEPLEPQPDWLDSAGEVLARWFSLEDPTRLEPAGREVRVETELPSGLVLRGIVDRLDVAPDGAVRITDYKTGNSASEGFEERAFFQLKFYGLVLWRTNGVVPRMLQLVYLGDSQVLRYEPDEADLRATERKVEAIWEAVQTARRTGVFEPSPGRRCDWCSFKSLCPAWGGTPPPLPER